MIKLVIFDAYGVTLTGGFPLTMKALAQRFNRNWEDLQNIFYTKYFNQAAERKITQQQAWELAIKETKLKISIKEIKEIHYSFMNINKDIIPVINKVKKDNKIAILLTKNTREQHNDVNKKLNFTKYFDDVINTWELNLPKASKETIKYVLKKFNVKSGETIYIDDQENNLQEAKKLGVHTIFYKNLEQFKKEFDTLYM